MHGRIKAAAWVVFAGGAHSCNFCRMGMSIVHMRVRYVKRSLLQRFRTRMPSGTFGFLHYTHLRDPPG